MTKTFETNTPNKTIRTSLFKHCTEGDTGIVFLTTKNNKCCKIYLAEGEVEAITLGRFAGQDAALELKKVGFKGSSFSDKFKLPYAKSAIIDSSEKVLKQLGYVTRRTRRVNDGEYSYQKK